MVALLVIFLVAAALAIDVGVRVWRRKHGIDLVPQRPRVPLPEWALMPFESIKAPAGLFYSPGHTWVRLAPDGMLELGLDDFLGRAVGPIDHVELRPEGTRIRAGEPFARVTQDKMSLWVNSPVSGTIRRSHRDVAGSTVNEDPYGEGWLAQIEASDPGRELSILSIGDKVRRWLENEALRFGQFLAAQTQPAGAFTMQDGGVPVERRLAALGPEGAMEFERQFLSKPKGV